MPPTAGSAPESNPSDPPRSWPRVPRASRRGPKGPLRPPSMPRASPSAASSATPTFGSSPPTVTPRRSCGRGSATNSFPSAASLRPCRSSGGSRWRDHRSLNSPAISCGLLGEVCPALTLDGPIQAKFVLSVASRPQATVTSRESSPERDLFSRAGALRPARRASTFAVRVAPSWQALRSGAPRSPFSGRPRDSALTTQATADIVLLDTTIRSVAVGSQVRHLNGSHALVRRASNREVHDE